MMEYVQEQVSEATMGRVGALSVGGSSFALPAVAPCIRTRIDVSAVDANRQNGVNHNIISPLLSRHGTLKQDLHRIATQERLVEGHQRPLIIPDIESEAFSFNCVAQHRFSESARGTVMDLLLSTCLGSTKDGNTHVYTAWRRVRDEYKFVPLVKWIGRNLARIKSDVFMLPAPILRIGEDPTEALDHFKQMLTWARRNNTFSKYGTQFNLYGVQLLLHAEIFDTGPEPRQTRRKILEELRKWPAQTAGAGPDLRGLFVATKVHDPSGMLDDNEKVKAPLRNLSEFHSNVQKVVQQSGGVLVVHDTGNRALGLLNSGADIVSVKVTGSRGVEMPRGGTSGKTGPRDPPDLTLRRQMAEYSYDKIRAQFEQDGAFPVPEGVEVQPYWEYRWTDAQRYAARVRAGVFEEVADEYRNAVLNSEIPLREALRSRIMDAGNRDELLEICPSA